MIDNFSVKLLKNTRIVKQKESNIKLIYWLKGSGKINLDLDTYNMKKRDLVFIMLNDLYSIEGETNSVIAIIEISFTDYLRFADDYIRQKGYKFSSIERKQLESFIINLLEFESRKPRLPHIRDKLVKHLCVELGYIQRKHRQNYKLDNPLVDEVHEYIIEHHHEKINKQALANSLDMSNKELSQVIKFHTPYHNIAQYINDIRLKLCLLDILDSSEFIQDIAYKHGFNHFPRFIALFSKKYGMTPGQSRKKQFAPIYKATETVEISLDYEAQLLIAEAKSNYHT